MGGHGYSAFAGVGRLYADYLPSVTGNSAKNVQSLSLSSFYLRHLVSHQTGSGCPAFKAQQGNYDWSNPATSIHLLELRAAFLVQAHAQTLLSGAKTNDPNESVDASANQRISKAVTEAFVAARVGDMIASLSDNMAVSINERNKEVVGRLFLLYLLTNVENALTDLLSFNFLNCGSASAAPTRQDPTHPLRLYIKQTCVSLLPEAIGLSDAFGFADWDLDSALGVHDGKVYENLWKRAQEEPLNTGGEITNAYAASIKPILERGRHMAEARSKL